MIDWKVYAGIGLLVAGFGYGQLQYQRGRSAAEHAQAVASLEQYKKAADSLLLASQSAQVAIDGIRQVRNDFIKEYNDAMLNAFDCYADDGRMHLIRDLYPSPTAGQPD